jgi:nucleoid-associated protein YgaU
MAVIAGVEALLLHLAASVGRSLTDSGPAVLPADRAGELLTAALVLAAAAGWSHWCLVLVVTAAGHRTGRRAAAWIAPPRWRAAAATCLGLAVAAGVGVPGAGSAAGSDVGSGAARLNGLRLPDRPVGDLTPAALRTVASARAVTVAPGDSLWTLAAATLPPAAGDARVDHACRAWYAANRRTIGPDPDLIQPGQRLIAPDATERTSP